MKNFLIFLPLVLTHKIINTQSILICILSFFSFCFIASTIYIINDLIDIKSDREDPIKCKRPFASGQLNIHTGYLLIAVLLTCATFLLIRINTNFIIVCMVYMLLTIIYSVYLKKVIVLDVIVLSAFYVIRILAGAIAINAEITNWLLAFSLFFFLSMALVKRVAEIQQIGIRMPGMVPGRGYAKSDLTILFIYGPVCGLISILILMLYITEQQSLHKYLHPEWLWGVSVLLLYWVMRVWFLVNRQQVYSDPILFAIRDLPSYGIAILALSLVYLAI
ncbi:MAG: UbiA family prenyltransferase [Gammaproteobacteria bacterium]|nr:UbiA family prenyltransferase [Gammaproteobacteria bacterium]